MNRINHAAVILCAVVCYGIESLWFGALFGKQWLAALGTTVPELMARMQGRPLWPLFASAYACDLVLAYVLAWVLVKTGVQNALGGIKVAAILWLGFVATITLTNYSFELRNLQLAAIDAGCPLVGMLITGAILAAWRTKPSV
jgi:small basic protein